MDIHANCTTMGKFFKSSKIVLSTFLFAFVRMNKKAVQNLVHIVV